MESETLVDWLDGLGAPEAPAGLEADAALAFRLGCVQGRLPSEAFGVRSGESEAIGAIAGELASLHGVELPDNVNPLAFIADILRHMREGMQRPPQATQAGKATRDTSEGSARLTTGKARDDGASANPGRGPEILPPVDARVDVVKADGETIRGTVSREDDGSGTVRLCVLYPDSEGTAALFWNPNAIATWRIVP